jgi:hypothetical protein
MTAAQPKEPCVVATDDDRTDGYEIPAVLTVWEVALCKTGADALLRKSP